MGGLTCGSPLPNIKTHTCQVTSAPGFYTCYLNTLAKTSTDAAKNAQYVGAQPLQTAAFNEAGANVGNYQPALNTASCFATSAGTSDLGALTNNLMSPYIHNVVCAIGTLGEQNILNNIAPQATAGLVGSGQFGSTRGVGALGQTLANAGAQITGQQACALEKGYFQAQCAAEKEIQNELNAGNLMNTIANSTSALGINCENTLATLGAQCQAIKQNAQCFALNEANKASGVLKGYTIPTAVSSTYCGPIPGAYNASPLSTAAGLAALAGGISCTALGKAIGCSISKYVKCLGTTTNTGGGNGTTSNGSTDTGGGNGTTSDGSTDTGGGVQPDPNAGNYSIDNNPWLNWTPP